MTQCSRCRSVASTASQALVKSHMDPGVTDSIKTVVKELAAEVKSLEDQIKIEEVDDHLNTTNRIFHGESDKLEMQELEKLIESFGLKESPLQQKSSSSQPSVDRSSFTRSTISTPMFQETFVEQEDLLSRSNKKTQSEIQLMNYEITSKGMFWIEDTLHPEDRFFLAKVGAPNGDQRAGRANIRPFQTVRKRKIWRQLQSDSGQQEQAGSVRVLERPPSVR